MSSSGVDSQEIQVPVKSFSYRDMGAPVPLQVNETRHAGAAPEPERAPQAAPGVSPQELKELLSAARVEAVAQTEARLKMEYEARSTGEADKIRQALELFQVERREYFSRVESDVVQLALAISAKILHREAQVDPMLVAALVRVAIDKLHDGSSVSVRVAPAEAGKWRAFPGQSSQWFNRRNRRGCSSGRRGLRSRNGTGIGKLQHRSADERS